MARRLVDGMNVIGSRPTGWWRDRPGAMRRLAAQLSDWAQATGERVTLVLDGGRVDLGDHAGVEVVFAAERGEHGRNAGDRVLAALAEEAADRDELIAVTSDSELAERLAALGVAVEGAGGFAERLG